MSERVNNNKSPNSNSRFVPVTYQPHTLHRQVTCASLNFKQPYEVSKACRLEKGLGGELGTVNML